MKAIINISKRTINACSKVKLALLTCILFLISPSCQKGEGDIFMHGNSEISDSELNSELLCDDPNSEMSDLYFGPKKFERGLGKPEITTQILSNPLYDCYDGNFVLKIRNGRDKRKRVSSAEITIDGVLILGPSDFSKHVSLITRPISGLTPESVLTIKLTSAPGSYLDLWIEGKINSVTPTFEQIGPLCQNSLAPLLPLSSTNNPAIIGTWNPEIINTSNTGKTIYTFTPAEGQCASPITMQIEISSSITPEFTQIGPLLQNSPAPGLPTTSTNGISGTWNPETINTANQGIFTFTFVPDASQCASFATMTINIGGVSDVEGTMYSTVKIGDQWWMAENLRTAKYNNGDLIETTIPATFDITGETAPKYQWSYDGSASNAVKFGRLYTWYAVTDNRSVCPVGWHVPSDTEWTTLSDYLINNGYGYQGSGADIGKSLAANSDWIADAASGNVGNDPASNNSSGFTALPAGSRSYPKTFSYIGSYAGWWSSTESYALDAWFTRLVSYSGNLGRYAAYKKHGASVRCIKD